VFVGPGALFEAGKEITIKDVTDGTSNTILVAESSDPVEWTKPEELTFDPAAEPSLKGVGSGHPREFHVVFADGSVHKYKVSLDPKVLRKLITRSGGEKITPADR
jgi:hypothetical protein